jgi:uncharacterized protein YneF (UPF0154 family)
MVILPAEGGLPVIEGGFILIARKLFENELMEKPPLYFKLWAWMLFKANFKDHGELKRGQFLTSINEMREAMSYWVGNRKMRPSRDEIRSPYEAFTKATMLTTAKTTRGMIITILNYDKYQNFKSYESHSEPHGENTPKPQASPHYKGKNEKKVIPFVETSDEVRLANLLFTKIKDRHNGHKPPNIQEWARIVNSMIRIDNRKPEKIEQVIIWCQSDQFWKGVILSTQKLRKQYDQLILKMESNKTHQGTQANEW